MDAREPRCFELTRQNMSPGSVLSRCRSNISSHHRRRPSTRCPGSGVAHLGLCRHAAFRELVLSATCPPAGSDAAPASGSPWAKRIKWPADRNHEAAVPTRRPGFLSEFLCTSGYTLGVLWVGLGSPRPQPTDPLCHPHLCCSS